MIGSYKMDTPDSVCPPRVRAMLASRACRSSVMIGDPLARNEMQKVILSQSIIQFYFIVVLDGCEWDQFVLLLPIVIDYRQLAIWLTSSLLGTVHMADQQCVTWWI